MHARYRALFIWMLAAFSAAAHAADIEMRMTTDDGNSKVSFMDASDSEVAALTSAGRLEVSSNVAAGGYVSLPTLNAPGPASPGRARLFARDVNGNTVISYVDENGETRVLRSQANHVLSQSETAATNLGTTYKDVQWALTAAKLSRSSIDFVGFTEARVVFAVDNNEADSITCRAYNETDDAEVAVATSDTTGNPQLVTGAWTPISLSGEKVIWAQCREGTGATADPDIGPVRIQLR